MAKRLINLSITLISYIIVVYFYTLIHEGAHGLLAAAFGGKLTAFDINIFNGYPHVSWVGELEPLHTAMISIAGPIAPFLVFMILMAFISKNSNLFIQKIMFFYALIITGSLVPNIIIPLLYEKGAEVKNEDISKFIVSTGISGYIVTVLTSILFIFAVLLIRKRINIRAAFTYQIDIKNSGKKVKTTAIVMVIIFSSLTGVAFFHIISKNLMVNSNTPMEYNTAINIDLSNINQKESEIYELNLETPMLCSFYVRGMTREQSEIKLSIKEAGKILGIRSKELVVSSGKGEIDANFTNWFLYGGKYSLKLDKTGSEGNLTIYINSKTPEKEIIQEADKEQNILNGIIPLPENGFNLVAQADLSDTKDQTIYEFTVSKDTNINFNIYLTTKEGVATVDLIGDDYSEQLISENQIMTENWGSFVQKGNYKIVANSSNCDGDVYVFMKKY